jgi:hypothetical protein
MPRQLIDKTSFGPEYESDSFESGGFRILVSPD